MFFGDWAQVFQRGGVKKMSQFAVKKMSQFAVAGRIQKNSTGFINFLNDKLAILKQVLKQVLASRHGAYPSFSNKHGVQSKAHLGLKNIASVCVYVCLVFA